jgi:[NiFe] hydrogenase assembly HybE family chaperone
MQMSNLLKGFDENPSSLIQTVFEDIHQTTMKSMPFCKSNISVKVSELQQIDGQWVGAILTPWMLSLLIFPSHNNHWIKREITSKVGISLANGDYTFVVGEHEQLGQYLSCSLLSPIEGINDDQQGAQILTDIVRLAWALPCIVEYVDKSKRHLFSHKQAASELESLGVNGE